MVLSFLLFRIDGLFIINSTCVSVKAGRGLGSLFPYLFNRLVISIKQIPLILRHSFAASLRLANLNLRLGSLHLAWSAWHAFRALRIVFHA